MGPLWLLNANKKISWKPFRIRVHLFLSFFLIYLELKQQIRSYTAVVPIKTVLDSRPKLGKSFFPFSAEIACEQALHVWGGIYNV